MVWQKLVHVAPSKTHMILPREELVHHLVALLSNLSIGQKEIILSRMTHHKVNLFTLLLHLAAWF